jgi:hypothetical protein
MKTANHDAILSALSELLSLSPGEYRIGQLLALMGDFGQMEYGYPLAELEDDQLLSLLNQRIRDCRKYQSDASPGKTVSFQTGSNPLLSEHI